MAPALLEVDGVGVSAAGGADSTVPAAVPAAAVAMSQPSDALSVRSGTTAGGGDDGASTTGVAPWFAWDRDCKSALFMAVKMHTDWVEAVNLYRCVWL